MRRGKDRFRISVMLLIFLLSALGFAGICGAIGGTEVYVHIVPDVPANKKAQLVDFQLEIGRMLQFRLVRANFSGTDVEFDEGGHILVKGRNVPDPEAFKRFVTRRNEWSLVGSDEKPVLRFKNVQKVLVDTSNQVPAVAVIMRRPVEGVAKDAKDGDLIDVLLKWDDEQMPLTMTVANGGKAVRLSSPDMTEPAAWILRSAFTLSAYPCPVKVLDFRYGDDILKQIFG